MNEAPRCANTREGNEVSVRSAEIVMSSDLPPPALSLMLLVHTRLLLDCLLLSDGVRGSDTKRFRPVPRLCARILELGDS
jgi:hypothetical protein